MGLFLTSPKDRASSAIKDVSSSCSISCALCCCCCPLDRLLAGAVLLSAAPVLACAGRLARLALTCLRAGLLPEPAVPPTRTWVCWLSCLCSARHAAVLFSFTAMNMRSCMVSGPTEPNALDRRTCSAGWWARCGGAWASRPRPPSLHSSALKPILNEHQGRCTSADKLICTRPHDSMTDAGRVQIPAVYYWPRDSLSWTASQMLLQHCCCRPSSTSDKQAALHAKGARPRG